VPVGMAHEFGHAMQGRFGFAESGRSIQDETQADCLAGAWTA
jgi:predicted metalloprotease